MNDRVYKCLSANFFRVETFHKVRLAIFSPPCSYKERNCLSFERPRVPRVALCLFIESAGARYIAGSLSGSGVGASDGHPIRLVS